MGAVLLLLLLSSACLSTAGAETPTVPTPVSQDSQALELRVGASAPIPGTRATVTFERVSDDSRCPRGVTCVWEGDATVELRVVDERDAAEAVKLHANPRFSQQARAAGVAITLVSLEPVPEADRPVPPEAYSITLRVTR